jgi:hypothetical protein
MIRIVSRSILVSVIGFGLWQRYRPETQNGIDFQNFYLVVTIEGPDGWEDKHRFTIEWQGKTVELPVMFRATLGKNDGFQMGAGPEILHYLEIGKEKVPVTAHPDTDYQVRNSGGFAIIPEKSKNWGQAGMSLAVGVTISPSSFPGEGNPMIPGSRDAVSERISERLQRLIDSNRVIDLPKR